MDSSSYNKYLSVIKTANDLSDKDKAKDVLKDMEEMYPVGTAIGDKVRNLLKEI